MIRRRLFNGFGLVLAAVLAAACVQVKNPPPLRPKPNLPEAARINTELGNAYVREGDLAVAQEKLDLAIQEEPDYAPAHAALALLYVKRSDFDNAEREYRQALSISNGDPSIRNAVGAFLCDRGKFDEGLQDLKQSAQDLSYTTPEVAWTNAGVCAGSAKHPQEAEGYFREALRANPKYPDALLQMVRADYLDKNYLDARAYLQRFQSVAQPNPDSLYLGAVIERALGNIQDAHDYEVSLVQKFPNSDQARSLLKRPSP